MTDDLEIPPFLRRGKAQKFTPVDVSGDAPLCNECIPVVPHQNRAHAKLAPSASHRWIECPGSIKLSEGQENKAGVFAAEGTAAHEIAAHCLSNDYDANKFLNYVIDVTGKTFGERLLWPDSPLGDGTTRFEVDEEMVEGVQLYLDEVRAIKAKYPDAEIDVEVKLDMRHVHPDLFGTGDTVIYVPKLAWLFVFDLKYGKCVVVEVTENPQLFTYGIGALHRHNNREVKGITLFVVQPRAPHPDGPVRSWDADLIQLMEFEADLAMAAAATDAPDAPLKAGDWCRFCPAMAYCPEARRQSQQTALAEFAEPGPNMGAEKLGGQQLADVLKSADFIGNWVKSVQEYAHAEAVAGRCPPGFKLVPKRANRKWADEEAAQFELSTLYDEDALFTEPKFKSPAQIEKAIGKKAFAEHAALVTKISSGTNLVPMDDRREAVKTEGMEDFA